MNNAYLLVSGIFFALGVLTFFGFFGNFNPLCIPINFLGLNVINCPSYAPYIALPLFIAGGSVLVLMMKPRLN